MSETAQMVEKIYQNYIQSCQISTIPDIKKCTFHTRYCDRYFMG
jgi:hypothetical protein